MIYALSFEERKKCGCKPVPYLIVNSDLPNDASVLLGADAGDGGQAHGDAAPLASFNGPEVKSGQVETDVPMFWVGIFSGVFLALDVKMLMLRQS